MEKLNEFLFVSYDSGSGSGSRTGHGSRFGDDDGYGSDFGDGSGDGFGNGLSSYSGFGCSSGSGTGSGDGSGSGCGSGYGSGSRTGHGYGYGSVFGDSSDIKNFCGTEVHVIDVVQTLITKVKGNLAKGFILNEDLTTTPCYIAKGGNFFAHGETLKKAREALKDKLFKEMDEEERIN